MKYLLYFFVAVFLLSFLSIIIFAISYLWNGSEISSKIILLSVIIMLASGGFSIILSDVE